MNVYTVSNTRKNQKMGGSSVLRIATLLSVVALALLYSCPADGGGTSAPPVPPKPIVDEIREKNPAILYNANVHESAQSLFSRGDIDNPYLFTFGVTSIYLIEEVNGEMTIIGDEDKDGDGELDVLYRRNTPLHAFVATRRTLARNKSVLSNMYVVDSNALAKAREGAIAHIVPPVYKESDYIVGIGLSEADAVEFDMLPENITLRVRILYEQEVLKEKTMAVSKADPYEVRTWRDLQHINDDLTGNYVLQNDIIFPEVGEYGYENFYPIGWDSSPEAYYSKSSKPYSIQAFQGTFEGNNYKIEGLYINNAAEVSAGLFGVVSFGLWLQEARIRNVTVYHVGISGNGLFTGGLVGFLAGPTGKGVQDKTGTVIENSHVYAMSGAQVEGRRKTWGGTGGLVGYAQPFSFVLDNVSAHTDVKGHDATGGLVGRTLAFHIKNSYATGNVQGSTHVGGLVGRIYGGAIQNSYATGNVYGKTGVGGLAGSTEGQKSVGYATGDIKGNAYVGGLVGFTSNSALGHVIDDVVGSPKLIVGSTTPSVVIGYASGDVEGVTSVGGLLGGNEWHWYITSVPGQKSSKRAGVITVKGYSTGKITGTDYVGGVVGYSGARSVTLVGYTRSTIQFSHADTAGLMIGKLGEFVDNRSINGYASTAGSNSNGVNGEHITISEVTDDNYQTVFQNLTFGEGEGQWTWVGAGQWPAINIGDTAPMDDQPTQ